MLVALLGTGCAVIPESARYALERRLTYYPFRLPTDAPPPPGVESVWFETVTRDRGSDCPDQPTVLRLNGILADPPCLAERRAVVLYCHGNKGNVDECAERVAYSAKRHNITIFTFDYRGFGRSDGHPDEEGLIHDARAARCWLAQRCGIAEESVVVLGISLGGAVAVQLAARDGCRGLVLENTFTSVRDIADHLAYPLAKPSEWMRGRLNSIEDIKRYHGPLLQRHGDADPLIPFEMGRRVFEAAPGPKRFVAAPGGRHRTLPNEEFEAALDEFLAALPPEQQRYNEHGSVRLSTVPTPPPIDAPAIDAVVIDAPAIEATVIDATELPVGG